MDATDYAERPELALVALLEMLHQCHRGASPALAASIRTHLLVVAADTRHPEAVRDAAGRLALEWCTDLVSGEHSITTH